MNGGQTEITLGGCIIRFIWLVIGVVAWLGVYQAIDDHYELRDAQRRIATLEQQCK